MRLAKVPKQPAASRKLPRRERAADWIVGHQWIAVGLSRGQAKILSLIGKHWRFKNAPTATAALVLLSAALDDWPRMERRFDAVCRKTRRRPLTVGPYFQDKALAFLAERGIA